MAQINVVVLEGNLVADAECRHFGTKGIETSFTVANNSGFGDYAKTTFMKCKLYGTRGEKLVQYLEKGTCVTVNGNILVDSYDKEGEKKYVTYIKVSELSFRSNKSSGGNSGYADNVHPNSSRNDDIPF